MAKAEQQADKAELAKAEQQADKAVAPKMVKIHVPAPEGAPRDEAGKPRVAPLEVFINGKRTEVPVGVPVEVTESVYQVLVDARRI